MRVLVLSLNYAPEPTGFAPHVAGVCEYLAGRSHAVTVMTGFPFAPAWKRAPGDRRRFLAHQQRAGVDVWRLTHFIPRRPGSVWQRMLMEGTFGASAAILLPLLRCRQAWDVILYVGAQPSIGMVARWGARLLGIPYVVNIQDLAAQAAADVGIVKIGPLFRAMRWFEFAAYRRAAGAMVLCEAFRDVLTHDGYRADRIRLIRSPVDVERIRPVAADPAFRRGIGLAEDDFVVLFSGSMGLKQGLMNVLEAARQLKAEQPSVKWVFVGDGQALGALRVFAETHALQEHVRFIPLQPEAMMSTMFAAADVLLLNQVSAVKDTVIPSKLLTYMASGKAVLAAINERSQGATILRDAEGGVIVRPEDPAALMEGVKVMRATDQRPAMGRRNRAYAEQHFDQRNVVAEQERFLLDIVQRAAI